MNKLVRAHLSENLGFDVEHVFDFEFFWQVHKVVTGIGPLRPLVRIGAAAGQLLAIPMEQLRAKGFPKPYEGTGSAARSAPPVSWQLQRGLTGRVSH